MTVLRIGLVGAGSMGSLHARVLSGSSSCELACIVDPSEESGRALADRFEARWLPELDGTKDLDAVVIASATETHHDIAMRLLSDGVPLLVEKPLADTLTHTEEIIDASRKTGVPLMCGLLERYNPAIVTAMEFVEAPQHVMATRHSPYVQRIRTGVASDLLVHDVDVILRMAGSPPVSIRSASTTPNPRPAPRTSRRSTFVSRAVWWRRRQPAASRSARCGRSASPSSTG
jgi:predicted dehydrogenase